MDVPQVIQLLLNRLNTRGVAGGLTFSAFDGTTGNVNILQRDANEAIKAWHTDGDTSKLRQLAASLHAYGHLTDTEYEQIMEALDGENKWD
jgi:hypothetical protein